MTGMFGWFEPRCRVLFTATFAGVPIDFVAMGLWDAHPEGRVGLIIDQSPRSQHMFLRKYFMQFDALQCQLAECTQLGPPSSGARILHTHYMDNAYLTLCNVPEHTHPQLRAFVEILHTTVYNIKMKWETTGVHCDWCDARLFSEPAMNLMNKGVPWGAANAPATALWDRWPNSWSSGCPTVVRSIIPALLQKGLTLNGGHLAIERNIQTIVQGCGYKHYLWRWWWQTVRVRLKTRGFLHLVPLHTVKRWYEQGKEWAMPQTRCAPAARHSGQDREGHQTTVETISCAYHC